MSIVFFTRRRTLRSGRQASLPSVRLYRLPDFLSCLASLSLSVCVCVDWNRVRKRNCTVPAAERPACVVRLFALVVYGRIASDIKILPFNLFNSSLFLCWMSSCAPVYVDCVFQDISLWPTDFISKCQRWIRWTDALITARRQINTAMESMLFLLLLMTSLLTATGKKYQPAGVYSNGPKYVNFKQKFIDLSSSSFVYLPFS